MIINTGQRTDIPAFYAKWFINRIRAGFVMVRNPYYPTLISKLKLNPDVVDVIGFCTKNPRPMFQYLDEIKDFGQFWYISITGFDKDYEPNVPPIDQVIEDFKFLSNKVGKHAIAWRYTPIIIDQKYTLEYHIKTFEYIASKLDGYTSLAVFGFIDLYEKLVQIHPEIHDCDDASKIEIAKAFSNIAKNHHMELRLCSKEKWLKEYGIDVNGCMRIDDYEHAIQTRLDIKEPMQARKGYCSCYLSHDIGAYNCCPHQCKYCYANGDVEVVMKNVQNHDDDSPLIIGNITERDKIREPKQESYRRGMLLF